MDEGMGPIDSPHGSEELTDIIASIEMERQASAREAGNATACAASLRKLRELQCGEKEALQSQGPSADHSANLAALTMEIARVEKLTGTANRLSLPGNSHRDKGKGARRDAQRSPLRTRGRRTTNDGGKR